MNPLEIPNELNPCSQPRHAQEWPDQLKSKAFLQMSRQDRDKSNRQFGGLGEARGYLKSFLEGRGAQYRVNKISGRRGHYEASRRSCSRRSRSKPSRAGGGRALASPANGQARSFRCQRRSGDCGSPALDVRAHWFKSRPSFVAERAATTHFPCLRLNQRAKRTGLFYAR